METNVDVFIATNPKLLVPRVNLDASPYIPAGCSILEHRKGGLVIVERITLYSSKKVKLLKQVLEDVEGEFTANASFLDYLISNKRLIPDDWKGLKVLFTGTIYQFQGKLFVRGLAWDNVSWECSFYSLDTIFSEKFALVLLG